MKKYPISIMIALGVTLSGFARPCFFQKGERLNGQTLLRSIVAIL